VPVLRELDPAECERLLRRGTFGRVVLVTPRGPDVVPVNYTVVGDAVVVRTAPDGTLARHADGSPVAFEVDVADDVRWQGWSVVARGVGRLVTDPPVGPDRARVRPWADGDRSAELHLRWTELTGRQVGVAWDTAGALFARRTAR
jgi:hypothetical protein